VRRASGRDAFFDILVVCIISDRAREDNRRRDALATEVQKIVEIIEILSYDRPELSAVSPPAKRRGFAQTQRWRIDRFTPPAVPMPGERSATPGRKASGRRIFR
jgi:hypothetical protein